ncbi:MAG TPA: sulfate permease [Vicinamibacteria bacterium]|nr:sulfate permease [Vicinamibacteria bacterium]
MAAGTNLVPALAWLRSYERGWLRYDLLAGVTLAAYLVPSAVADASLAGLPAQAGLYACLFSALVYWIFSGSRHTAITVTSAISLLLGSSLGSLAGGDPARFGALAACTALMVGAIGLLARIVRAGATTSFFSESVMVGFKAGIGLVLASTQLPKLCGFASAHGGSFWERAAHFLRHLPETNPASLALGLGAVALLLAGKLLAPRQPVALPVVAGGIVLARVFDLGAHSVSLLGRVPTGLPTPALPRVLRSDINELLPLAFACFLLGAVESVAIGRTFAAKHGYRLDPNQEFLALGAANLAAGLGWGYPVSGGMSQSLVNESGGARTPLATFVAGGIVLAVTLFLSGLLADLPQPVLAAVVLMALSGLVKVGTLRRLWRAHRSEFFVALAAFVGVLGSGILRGVLIGSILSLLVLMHRAARPHVAFLGRIPGTARFSDMERHHDNEPVPGAVLFRVDSAIVYFNAEAVREAVWARIDESQEPIRLAICDLSAAPVVDMAGAEMVAGLAREFAARGIALRVVEAHASVREMLRLEGLEQQLGPITRRATLAQAVEDFFSRGETKASHVRD